MIRVTRETDHATAVLARMAQSPETRFTAAVLAGERGLPAAIVSKVLKRLARAGLLVSHRGARGGYRLARPAAAISVADVVRAIEGPIALTDCVEGGDEACPYSAGCTMGGNWARISGAILEALEGVSIEAMRHPLPRDHASLRGIDIRIKSAVS